MTFTLKTFRCYAMNLKENAGKVGYVRVKNSQKAKIREIR